MFIISFDFGIKNIGIAIGQTITKTANPIVCIHVKNNNLNWYSIEELINVWLIKKAVVGKPCFNHNNDRFLSSSIKDFVCILKIKYNLKVFFSDESFTSCSARSYIKENSMFYNSIYSKKCNVHSISAVLILERWLNLNY